MNSLFNDLQSTPSAQPLGQIGNFLTQFNQFRSNFVGNPEQQVKQLISSGKMSQQQFEQIAQTANQLRQLIK